MAALDELRLRERTLAIFLGDNGGLYQIYDIKPFREGPGTDTQLRVQREEFSNAPLRAGKGSHYEGGIRVPCLVRWPTVIAPGTVVTTPVHVVDWAATFLDLAGAPAPGDHPLDGISLAPLFGGRPLPGRALYWYTPFYELLWGVTPSATIRDGDWKRIDFFGDSFDAQGRYRSGARVELFNLRTDFGETTDLSTREPVRARAL